MADKPNKSFAEKLFNIAGIQKDQHVAFRHYYSPQQTYALTIATMIAAVYGIFADLVLSKAFTLSSKLYFAFFLISIVSLGNVLILNNRKWFKEDLKREKLQETFQMIIVMAYLCWGLAVIKYSIDMDRTINFLPVMIVYAICSFFLYFSPHHYVVMYSICIISALVISFKLKNGDPDFNILLNVIFLGGVLTVGGLVKYKAAIQIYFDSIKNQELQDSIEANNEELSETNFQLIELTESLRKANESQRLFSAKMNHELRSPLNGIIGLLQIIGDDPTLSDDTKDNVNKALSSSHTLIQIVNDLLDYAKLEAGEFSIIETPFDLRNVVSNIAGIQATLAKEKGLDFEVVTNPNMPCMFTGDGIRLQQIITNLISNGIKYTESGFVKADFDYSNGILVIKVSDSGQGIAPDALKILFEPFKRLSEHKNRGIQGTGLGLSIVKSLVAQMRGDISVESTIGKGSTFTVNIPLAINDYDIKFADSVEEKVTTDIVSLDLSDKKIMCIDDNRVNLSVFKGLLKSTDASLKLCLSGAECLEEITKEKYDLIFIDHMMPEMDGVETFMKMQEFDHLNKETPIVMLTANVSEEAEQAYMEKGFTAYLAKPILKQSLFSLIDKLLCHTQQ